MSGHSLIKLVYANIAAWAVANKILYSYLSVNFQPLAAPELALIQKISGANVPSNTFWVLASLISASLQ